MWPLSCVWYTWVGCTSPNALIIGDNACSATKHPCYQLMLQSLSMYWSYRESTFAAISSFVHVWHVMSHPQGTHYQILSNIWHMPCQRPVRLTSRHIYSRYDYTIRCTSLIFSGSMTVDEHASIFIHAWVMLLFVSYYVAPTLCFACFHQGDCHEIW